MSLICDVQRKFMVGGVKVPSWVPRLVAKVEDGAKIRCLACKGKVRHHHANDTDSPTEHVEHIHHDDSVKCRLGVNHVPGSPHQVSNHPVL